MREIVLAHLKPGEFGGHLFLRQYRAKPLVCVIVGEGVTTKDCRGDLVIERQEVF